MGLLPLYYINVSIPISVWFSLCVCAGVCVYVCAHAHMCTCRTQVSFEIVLYSSTLFPWDRFFQTNPELIDAVFPLSSLLLVPPLASSVWIRNYRKAGTCNWSLALGIDAAALTQTWASCFPTTLQPWNPSEIESQRFVYFYSVCLNIKLGWMYEQPM